MLPQVTPNVSGARLEPMVVVVVVVIGPMPVRVPSCPFVHETIRDGHKRFRLGFESCEVVFVHSPQVLLHLQTVEFAERTNERITQPT